MSRDYTHKIHSRCFFILVGVSVLLIVNKSFDLVTNYRVLPEPVWMRRFSASENASVLRTFPDPVPSPYRRRAPTDGAWVGLVELVTGRDFRMFLYTAFCDRRHSLDSPLPKVRVIMEVDKTTDHRKLDAACVVTYGDGRKVTLPASGKGQIGYGVYMKEYDRYHIECVFTCDLPSPECPIEVTMAAVVPWTNQTVHTGGIPVEKPKRYSKKLPFGVCIRIAYVKLDAIRFIEWVEMQRILGVSKIGFYNYSVPNESAGAAILRYYSQDGILELRQSAPFLKDPTDGFEIHSSPVINDCIYRNMNRFRKIIVQDFDEIIIPRRNRSLSEMLARIDSAQPVKHPARNYVFRNNYYFLDFRPDASQYEHSVLLRHRAKIPPSAPGYSVKSIIDPQACVRMHNHYCLEIAARYSRQGAAQSVDVSPDVGLNQHYKRCHFSAEECRRMMEEQEQDDRLLEFKQQLTEAIEKVIQENKEILGQ